MAGSGSSTPGDLKPGLGEPGLFDSPADPVVVAHTIPATVFLALAHTRTIPATAFLLGTFTRTVPATAFFELAATRHRTVTQAVAFQAPSARTVPQAVAILRAGNERAVPQAVAFSFAGGRVVPQAIAFSRQVVTALVAPTRPSLMPSLLATLNPLYDRDPAAARALDADPGTQSFWRVDGNLLEVAAGDGSIAPFVLDLRWDPADTRANPARRDPLTITRLAALLTTAGYAATAASGWGAVLANALLDGGGDLGADGGLDAFTSILWRVLRFMAAGLDLIADDADYGLRQLDLRYAEREWLDWWGQLYGVPRLTHEDDAPYRTRVAYLTMRPRVNNVAIKDAIRAIFGIVATVVDGDPLGSSEGDPASTRDMDLTWDDGQDQDRNGLFWPGYPPRFVVTLPTGTDPATTARIDALVNSMRAAGVRYTVAFA